MPNFVFPVAEYMTAPVIIAHVGDDLNLAQKLLSEHRVSALAVVDAKHQLAGVISRTDLLKIGRIQAGAAMKASLLTLPHRSVEDVMTKDVVTVQTTDSLEKATQLMVEKRLHRIFITQENHPIGVLSTKDIMRAVAEKRINAPLTEFMSSPVFTVRAN